MMWLAIITGSLLGSAHCAGMCGGFAVHVGAQSSSRTAQAWYHLGRLCTYLVLGALAGVVGAGLNMVGNYWLLPHFAAILCGSLMIATALLTLSGQKVPSPKALKHLGAYGVKFGLRSSVPFFLGLTSTLLPCGWLYLYLGMAASAGSALTATMTMFCFWLGTLPALSLLSWSTQLMHRRYLHMIPRISACIVLLLGLATMWLHVRPLIQLNTIGDEAVPPCHHHEVLE